MMKLTSNAIQDIKTALNQPLNAGELRQIETMGNLFVAQHKFPEDDEGTALADSSLMDYWFQYSMKIDGIMYYFYGGTPLVK